jgi:hypothetical protein
MEIAFSIIFSVIGTIIGINLYRRFYAKDITRITDNDVNNLVTRIFKSDSFYNTFNNVLPKGENDDKYGIDFIPYLLKSINEKRKRFESTSNRFLTITIILGILFISAVVGFGYILLNDDEFGLSSQLKKIESQLNNVNKELSSQNTDLYNNPLFEELCSESYRKIKYNKPYELSDENKNKLDSLSIILSNSRYLENSIDLNNQLILFTSRFNSYNKADSIFLSDITSFQNKLSEFLDEKESSFTRLNGEIKRLESYNSKIGNNLSEQNNRIAEILKRLILSLVIISFFLAILKYTTQLYKWNYKQMMRAELEDFYVRKFYISFKASEDKPDDRIKLLTEFMQNNNIELILDEKSSSNKEEISLIKGLFDALIKKV